MSCHQSLFLKAKTWGAESVVAHGTVNENGSAYDGNYTMIIMVIDGDDDVVKR